MKLFRSLTMALVVAALTACAALGLPTPDTFNQKAAVAISTVTEVRSQATTLLVAKKITVADAQNVQAQADTAMAGIAVARQVAAADMNAGNARLTAVVSVLTALQAYLAVHGK